MYEYVENMFTVEHKCLLTTSVVLLIGILQNGSLASSSIFVLAKHSIQ